MTHWRGWCTGGIWCCAASESPPGGQSSLWLEAELSTRMYEGCIFTSLSMLSRPGIFWGLPAHETFAHKWHTSGSSRQVRGKPSYFSPGAFWCGAHVQRLCMCFTLQTPVCHMGGQCITPSVCRAHLQTLCMHSAPKKPTALSNKLLLFILFVAITFNAFHMVIQHLLFFFKLLFKKTMISVLHLWSNLASEINNYKEYTIIITISNNYKLYLIVKYPLNGGTLTKREH